MTIFANPPVFQPQGFLSGLSETLPKSVSEVAQSVSEDYRKRLGINKDLDFKTRREQRLLRKDMTDMYNKRINFLNQDIKESLDKKEIDALKLQKKNLMKEMAQNQKRLRMGDPLSFDYLEEFEAGDIAPIQRERESISKTTQKPPKAQTIPKQTKPKFDPNNKAHQNVVLKTIQKYKGDREKAKKELDKMFSQ